MEEENKYHFAREIIFNLRACKQITDVTYIRWIDKLIGEEKQAKNNDVLDLVSGCKLTMHQQGCDKWMVKNEMGDILTEGTKQECDDFTNGWMEAERCGF